MHRPPSGPLQGADLRSSTVLRLRGADTEQAWMDARRDESARLRVPSREVLHAGQPVVVEISFGPLVDEVTLPGVILSVEGTGGTGAIAEVSIPKHAQHRVSYVRQILAGDRQASARRHRRVPVDFDVRWTDGASRYASRARDLSRGGAFIASRSLPSVGERVDVELRPPHREHPLRLGGVVSWVRPEGHERGFGVHFKLRDRAAAADLHDVVRALEAPPSPA